MLVHRGGGRGKGMWIQVHMYANKVNVCMCAVQLCAPSVIYCV